MSERKARKERLVGNMICPVCNETQFEVEEVIVVIVEQEKGGIIDTGICFRCAKVISFEYIVWTTNEGQIR